MSTIGIAAGKQDLPMRLRILRRLNPVVVSILRSPVHAIMSKKLLVLEYTGQKTGKTYTIPLAYVIHAGAPYCATRDSSWWKSAVHAPSVTIWLRGRRLNARAERAANGAPETRAAFIEFLSDNPGTSGLVYGVRVDSNGKPDPAAVDRELPHSNVIRLTLAT